MPQKCNNVAHHRNVVNCQHEAREFNPPKQQAKAQERPRHFTKRRGKG
jgi:hypothetical protein